MYADGRYQLILLAFTHSKQNRTGPECNFAELGKRLATKLSVRNYVMFFSAIWKWKPHGIFYLYGKVCIFYLPTIYPKFEFGVCRTVGMYIFTNTPMYGLKQLELLHTIKQTPC